MTLVDDLGRILFVLGLSGKGKGVLTLAIGNLVDPTFAGQRTLLQCRDEVEKQST